jgi:glycosyltransferase involved in cell wall biosynthesis
MFVTQSAYPLGGVPNWLDYLDSGLQTLGWRTTVGLVEGGFHHKPEKYTAIHPHRDWISIPCFTGTPEGRSEAVMDAVEKVQANVIVTANLPDAVYGAAKARLSCGTPPKIVVTIHGIQPDIYDDLGLLNDFFDKVICTNRLSCRLAEARGAVSKDRIAYAPYGVHVTSALPAPRKHQSLVLAYVGRLEQAQKRVFDLPLVLEQLVKLGVPCKMLIAGTGPDEKELKNRLKILGHIDLVEFLGFVPPEHVADRVLRNADLLLLTSSWETGPLVVWEAMAEGVPVVSTRYIGSQSEESLRSGVNAYLYEVGDHRAAAQIIAGLWSNEAMRKSIRDAAHSLVLQRYSIPVSVHAWDAELTAVLEKPKVHSRDLPIRSANSRLDKLLGPRLAEATRRKLNVRRKSQEPGGEWPHTIASTQYSDVGFWKMAEELDSRT